MMFEGEDRQTLQSLIDNGTITPEHQKMPCDALDAIGITVKAKKHSGIFGMIFSLMSASSLMRVSMPCLPVSAPSSPNVSLPTPDPGDA